MTAPARVDLSDRWYQSRDCPAAPTLRWWSGVASGRWPGPDLSCRARAAAWQPSSADV